MINYSFLFDYIRRVYAQFAYNKKTGAVKMPIRYILELTYNCNLRCPFCYITGDRNKNELTEKEWLDIIEQIPRFSFITFCAGEVLLKKDFIKIFEKASEKFRKVSLISNGLALNEQIIDSLVNHKLFLLSVSLDGYGKNHDISRNCPGLWDKVINNLEVFNSKRTRSQGKRVSSMLDIKTCVLSHNLDDIPLLYKKAIELNAQFFSLTFIRKQSLRQNSVLWDNFSEEFWEKDYPVELYFDMEHFKEIYKELADISKKSKTILRYAPRFTPSPKRNSIEIEKFFNSGAKPVTELYEPCRIPMTSIYITPEGFIYPCLSYKTGNLKEQKLREAINTSEAKNFRKKLYNTKVFNACQMCCDLIPKKQ